MGVDAEMFVRTRVPLSELEVRKLSVDLVECFGTDNLMVTRPGQFTWEPEGRHALQIVDKYEQDGPDILPEPGEQFIRVHLFNRYYGRGYERGHLPAIIMVAMWLEARIPDAVIWYGGDSSGVCAEPFGPKERDELWRYFCDQGHRRYNSIWGRGEKEQTCAFCADNVMTTCMWAGDTTGYVCNGCGLHREVAGDGSIKEDPREWPREVARRAAKETQ